jgi:hypothetical protein
MKTKNLFLTVVLLFMATFNYAQTSAEASGIAIQGIARDANNTARIETQIILTYELYYKDASNLAVPIAGPEDITVTPDNFGVFSFVLEPGAANNAKIANQQAYLKISEGSTTISDEKLNHVPYAIAANNGVPTGSIMPWVGGENAVPAGWVLCNNQSLTGIVGSDNLIALVGNNAPDLRGMFLRGAGGTGNHEGPIVNEIQEDGIESHNHPDNFSIPTSGAHVHKISFNEVLFDPSGSDRQNAYTNQGTDEEISTNRGFPDAAHTHTINGGVLDNNGISETRPVNYGVNYIIKL